MAIGDLLAQINGEAPRPAPPATVATQAKRKADGELPRAHDKAPKLASLSSATERSVKPIRQPAGPTSTVSASRPGFNQTATAPSTKTSVSQRPNAPAKNDAPKNAPAAPAAPKKGSFKEIMARAAAAKAVAPQFGKIQHKPLERPPKEKEDAKLPLKNGIKNGKATPRGSGATARDSKASKSEGGNKSRTTSSEPEKRPKKAAPVTTGYQGTARPSGGAARRPPAPSFGSSRDRDRAPVRDRYRYVSEEEDQDDYDSAASSDMEAGLDEVDEEEERALRAARKEDQIAMAEEARLREEKRRRLANMAKNRR